MLLKTEGTATKVSGTSNPIGFKVKTSPELFKTMSDNLYNDKIRAVIRELSCNGWDAHVAADKKNHPFEVHLPTQFEPFFSVTDYGTGLKFVEGGCETCQGTGLIGGNRCEECDGTGNYDAVKSLYCTYFASDKQDSNKAIGGFGLGSKSPFAYLNNDHSKAGFIVVNHYNGKTYQYNAHISEHGFPEVVMLGDPEETPNESNGVTVSFPVHPKDIWEFENKAASVFEFFNPKPTLNKSINIEVPTYSIKTDLWGMRTNLETKQGSGLRAIMGNVQYTVGNIDISRLTEAQKKLVNMPIDLFFEVGVLQPAVSREALSLIGDTIDNILRRLDVVQNHLLEEIKKKIDVCRTGWEARLKIHDLIMQPGMGVLVNDAYNRGQLNGKYTFFKLDCIAKDGATKVVINEMDYQHIELISFRYNSRRSSKKSKKESLFEFVTSTKKAEAYRDLASNITTKEDYNINLDVNENTIYVINDLNTKADKYVNYLIQNNSLDNIYHKDANNNVYYRALVINRVNKNTPMNLAGDEAVNLLNHVGNPPMVKASDLKKVFDPLMKMEKEVQIVKRERMSARILSNFSNTGWSRNRSWKKDWYNGDDSDELNDPTATKFYVVIKGSPNFEPTNLPEFYSSRDFIKFVNKIRDSYLFPEITDSTPIFGIRDKSKLISNPLFVEFLPFVKNRVTATLTPEKEMELSLYVKPLSFNWKFVMDYVAEHPQLLASDSPFRVFSMAIHKAELSDKEGLKDLVEIAKSLGIDITNVIDYNQKWNDIQKFYPMLKICTRKDYYSRATIEDSATLVDYIRIADEFNKRVILSNVQIVDETETETETVEEEEEEETINA